jgi:magnesium transporter
MEVVHEQVSIAILKNVVLSFQERQGDVFDGVRDRIRTSKGLVRERGSDYLAYSLIDAVVDNIFSVLEKIGDGLETLEDETVENPTTETVHKIHELKKQMILVRKSVWPLREVVSHLERCGSSLIKQETQVYLRDVYDHLIQIIDSIETNRDVLSGMLDIYLSSTSNRLNEVMKFLTVVGTIFIPLTFISSVYGMNFRYMPEIDQVWGYPLTLVIMSLIAAYMLLYFRRKKWI